MTESELIEAHILAIQNFLKALVFKLLAAQDQNIIIRLVRKNFKLDVASLQKYCVEILSLKNDKFITQIEIQFKCCGQLLQIFDAYDVNPEFTVTFCSDDFTEPSYSPIKNIRWFHPKYFGELDLFLDQFKKINMKLGLQRLEWSAQKFEDFYDEITKPFLFVLLSS